MSIDHVVLGTGAVGRAVMQELVKRGEAVRMVNLSGKMAEAPAGVEVVAADLYDPAKVKEVTHGAKVVYQCSQPKYREWVEKFPALQQSIIDGLTGSGIKLVIVENLYMYGDTKGMPLTEGLPHHAHTPKGKVRSEISQAAFEAHKAGKVRVACRTRIQLLRPMGVTVCRNGRTYVLPSVGGQASPIDRKY